MHIVKPIEHADIAECSRTLKSAFVNDPLFVWLMGDEYEEKAEAIFLPG